MGADLNVLVAHARGWGGGDRVKPCITVMAVGVDDVERSLTFYREGVGLPTRGITGTEGKQGAVTFVDLQPGLKLAVWARKDIASEARIPLGLPSATEFMLGDTVASKAEVNAAHQPNRVNPITLRLGPRYFKPLGGSQRRGVNISSALFTRGIVMNIILAFALFPLLFLGSPAYAQNLCIDCLKAAQEELKKCLQSAISQEDKKSCVERQQARAKVCENGECEIERGKSTNANEVLPQKK